MEGLWLLMTVVGPILLLGAIILVWARNRKSSPAEIERADAGAEELRDDIGEDPEYRESPPDRL